MPRFCRFFQRLGTLRGYIRLVFSVCTGRRSSHQLRMWLDAIAHNASRAKLLTFTTKPMQDAPRTRCIINSRVIISELYLRDNYCEEIPTTNTKITNTRHSARLRLAAILSSCRRLIAARHRCMHSGKFKPVLFEYHWFNITNKILIIWINFIFLIVSHMFRRAWTIYAWFKYRDMYNLKIRTNYIAENVVFGFMARNNSEINTKLIKSFMYCII